MDFLRSIGNVLRGRNSHWNKENNAGWNALWSWAEQLNTPDEEIVKALLCGSGLFVDSILGPKRILDIGIDCLAVEQKQFAKLHEAFIDYAVGVYCKSRPNLNRAVLAAYEAFCSKDPAHVPIIGIALTGGCTAEEGSKHACDELCGLVANALGKSSFDPLVRYQVSAAAAIAGRACFSRIDQLVGE